MSYKRGRIVFGVALSAGLVMSLVAIGCSNGGGTTSSPEAGPDSAMNEDATGDTSQTSDTGGGGDSSSDGNTSDGNTSDGNTSDGNTSDGNTGNGCSGSTPVALKVLNFMSGCDVTIGTAAASAAAMQTVCVAAGVTNITATAASASFAIGMSTPWFGTDQNTGTAAVAGTDTGTGAMETSAVTVTGASGTAHCVSVCCAPTAASGTACPATNPCP